MNSIDKTQVRYPAVFEPAEEGGFNVSFPDFPGCVTFGNSFEHAVQMATEVLELWLEELAERGEEIVIHDYQPIIYDVKATVPVDAQLTYASAQS